MSFPNLDIPALDSSRATKNTSAAAPQFDEAQARRVALEFEAQLLTQLTASLNPSEDDAENNLFGSSEGSGLYRQMFSEQIASSMAQAGGIGISDAIIAQLRDRQNIAAQKLGNNNSPTARAINAARSIRTSDAPPTANTPIISTNTKAHRSASTTRSNASAATTQANTNADLYPEAIIISEASPTNTTATSNGAVPPAASESVSNSVRPRRVFDTRSPVVANDMTRPDVVSRSFVAASSLQMPVQGRISSHFGARHDPINGRHREHLGVDIAAPRGTPIASAASGTVVFAGWQTGYGNTVIIEHPDGRRTRYAHAEKLFVGVGDVVNGGQTIAAVGSTGHSTGPHLHFEVIEGDGRHIDPLRALANDLTLARR